MTTQRLENDIRPISLTRQKADETSVALIASFLRDIKTLIGTRTVNMRFQQRANQHRVPFSDFDGLLKAVSNKDAKAIAW